MNTLLLKQSEGERFMGYFEVKSKTQELHSTQYIMKQQTVTWKKKVVA